MSSIRSRAFAGGEQLFHIAHGLVVLPDARHQIAVRLPQLVTYLPARERLASKEAVFAAVLLASFLPFGCFRSCGVLGVGPIGCELLRGDCLSLPALVGSVVTGSIALLSFVLSWDMFPPPDQDSFCRVPIQEGLVAVFFSITVFVVDDATGRVRAGPFHGPIRL